ncbi:hypothetical protein ACQI4E_28130 [Streptomyces sp. CA-252508]|uniref:hypothetical protein n=1 Tax=Streptomyces sp. CA-252508 TaxID=3418946 RepID=UPI003D8BFAB8
MVLTVLVPRTRRRAAAFAGPALLTAGLLFTVSACGSEGAPAAERPAARPAAVSLEPAGTSLARAVETQATAQVAAARQAVDRGTGAGVCTTDPADRPACRNPGGTIDPHGGDVDGDGVFEPHEPVGPGHRDPRAYDGGMTSGETQCAWLRSQGKAC